LYIEYLNSARLRKFRDTYTRQVERFVDQFKSFESVNQKRELIASFLGVRPQALALAPPSSTDERRVCRVCVSCVSCVVSCV
jgi:hypothetical protein